MSSRRKTKANTAAAETRRLLPPLVDVPFVAEPPGIDRFEVRILPNGHVYFKGTRERIEEFLRVCAAEGLEVQIDHIALCG